MRYYAHINNSNVVTRVITGDGIVSDLAWCQRLDKTGYWVETIEGHSTERYAGKGMVYVHDDPRRFLFPNEVA